MFNNNKYNISDTDSFTPSHFPQLQTSLRQIAAEPALHPIGDKIEMILSFVKDHSIFSHQVREHPELADGISSQVFPLHIMEGLFAASRTNLLFRIELEDYIRSYFRNLENGGKEDQLKTDA